MRKPRVGKIAVTLEQYSHGQITSREAKREIARLLRRRGFSPDAIRWVLSRRRILDAQPPFTRWRQEFIVNSARRLSTGKSTRKQEANWYRLHRKVNAKRLREAKRISQLTNEYGPLLGWKARMDDRTTPECEFRHHKNFYVKQPPNGELPGVGTHVGCRCRSVPPYKNAEVLS